MGDAVLTNCADLNRFFWSAPYACDVLRNDRRRDEALE